MEEASNSVIHQTLHGYADGHTLLAASCDLTPVEKKALVLLSDLSGQAGNQSFDSYLTGYPLPGKRYYALARTWGAPEMPRPGCVWTQTLLIALPLLSKIRNLSELNALFKRPKQEFVNLYSAPIEGDITTQKGLTSSYKPTSSFYTIAYHLYNHSKDSIVIPADSSIDYEEEILNIWSQQWPRLRRAFTFCTGSLSIREIDNRVLDCQVVPHNYGIRLARQQTEAVLILDFSTKIRNASWFKSYQEAKPQQIQDFFYKYASDIIGKRSKFAPLCLAYTILNHEQKHLITLDVLLQFFKQHFNSAKEAKALKRDLINRIIEIEPDGRYNFIRLLLTSPEIDVLPESKLNLSEQIIELWAEDKTTTTNIIRLLEELNEDRISEIQKLELLSELPPELWLNIRWITDTILTEVIKNKPQVLEYYLFWQSPLSKQKVGLDLFITLSRGTNYSQLKKVVSAMLDADNISWIEPLIAKFKYFTLFTALDWLLHKDYATLPQKWEELVWHYPYEYLFWIASNQHYTEYTNDLMLQLFVSKNFAPDELDSNTTIVLLTQLVKLKVSDYRNSAMSIWLAKGLDNTHVASKEITTILFQPIYNIASQNRLDYNSWLLLSPRRERNKDNIGLFGFINWFLFESAPQSDEWDKCGQLRERLVESCIAFKWPSQVICKAISNRDTFERAMRYSLQFESGRVFFSKVLLFIQYSKEYKNSFYAKAMNAEYEKTKKGKRRRK